MRSLELTAKATGHKNASGFCDWYDNASQRIRSNPDAAQIWEVRHTGTHRNTPSLAFYATIFEKLDVTDRLEYGVMSPTGRFQPTGSMPPSEDQLGAVAGSRVGVFFAGYQTKEVLDVFESALPFIESLIGQAEKEFGSP